MENHEKPITSESVFTVGELLDKLQMYPRDMKVKVELGWPSEGPAIRCYPQAEGWLCIGGCCYDDLTNEE
jgi:hypothetical protein